MHSNVEEACAAAANDPYPMAIREIGVRRFNEKAITLVICEMASYKGSQAGHNAYYAHIIN